MPLVLPLYHQSIPTHLLGGGRTGSSFVMSGVRGRKNLLLRLRALLVGGHALPLNRTVTSSLDSAVIKELIGAYTMLCEERQCH